MWGVSRCSFPCYTHKPKQVIWGLSACCTCARPKPRETLTSDTLYNIICFLFINLSKKVISYVNDCLLLAYIRDILFARSRAPVCLDKKRIQCKVRDPSFEHTCRVGSPKCYPGNALLNTEHWLKWNITCLQ